MESKRWELEDNRHDSQIFLKIYQFKRESQDSVAWRIEHTTGVTHLNWHAITSFITHLGLTEA